MAVTACGAAPSGGGVPTDIPTTFPDLAHSTTSSSSPKTEVVEQPIAPFTSLAPAGAFEVVVLKRDERFPDNLPSGHYRIRLYGQESWPEECLGDVFVVQPSEPVDSGSMSGQDESWDEAAALEYQHAYEKAYAERCGPYLKAWTSDISIPKEQIPATGITLSPSSTVSD